MDERLKVAIIGVGFGQHVHLPVFATHPDCQVVALCGRNEEKLNEIADRYSVPERYTDWKDLITLADCNILSLAVPPNLQAEIIGPAMDRGLHLFLEKPLGLASGRGQDLYRKAESTARVVMVDYEFLHLPLVQKMKSLLLKRYLGSIARVEYEWKLQTYAFRKGLDSWKKTSAEGGGVVNLFASHSLSLMEFFFGPFDEVFAVIPDVGGLEPKVQIKMKSVDGITIDMNIDINAPLNRHHFLNIVGDEGCLELRNDSDDHVLGFDLIHSQSKEAGKSLKDPDQPEITSKDGRTWAVGKVADVFVREVCSSNFEGGNFKFALRVEALLGALRESARNQKWVKAYGA